MNLFSKSILAFSGMVIFSSCGVSPSHDQQQSHVNAPACGSIVGTIDGINAYSNGKNTGTGYSCAGENGRYGYLYQCKELVVRYFAKIYNAPFIACNAGQCLTQYGKDKKNYDTFENGIAEELPQHGDAIVFGGGKYGHIAVIDKVENNEITFVQQNTAHGTGSVKLDGFTIAKWGTMTTLGFIRSKNEPILQKEPKPVAP